jgi:hypothetical protein
VFAAGSTGKPSPPEVDIKSLHAKIGELTLENERLDETIQADLAGRCDAYTTDHSGLYSIRIQRPSSKDHVILPEIQRWDTVRSAIPLGGNT